MSEPEWGEPLTKAQIEADRALAQIREQEATRRLREQEETKRSRHTMFGVITGVTGATVVVLAIIGSILQGHRDSVERDRATSVACVEAGNAWVENSSATFECRKA